MILYNVSLARGDDVVYEKDEETLRDSTMPKWHGCVHPYADGHTAPGLGSASAWLVLIIG